MDKEEIVGKTETQRKEEQKVNMKAMRFGWLCVILAVIIIGVFRYINNETIADLLLIVTSHLTGTSFYQYVHTKKNENLFTAIAGLITLGLAFASLLTIYGVY